MYNGGGTRTTIATRKRTAACGQSPRRAKERTATSGAGLGPFLYLLTYTGCFLDEAFMYNNPKGSNLTFIWKLLAGFTTEVATDLI